jgi:mannan endo-1,4-beta-mannosidase
LFAWDLWNEIHPAQAEESVDCFGEFIHDLSSHVRTLEQRLYGRSHPQTVSLFGPELSLRPHLPMREPIFRHPDLNFASLHIYGKGTIDHPKNTVDAAISMGRVVQEAIAEIQDSRPFLDSEHGPIHTFKDRKVTLPEPFDDEYFRHMQWAHLATGGVGGGMRWPNRTPHTLTRGMRKAQYALANFLPLIDWARFQRRCLNATIEVSHRSVACFGCGDDTQAVVWLLRRDIVGRDGMLRGGTEPISPEVRVPCLTNGHYRVTAWNTLEGRSCAEFVLDSGEEPFLRLQTPPFATDLALALQRCPSAGTLA